jgi:hypothetical protein
MCSQPEQPKAPTNPVQYHPDEADSKAFSIIMEDENGVRDLNKPKAAAPPPVTSKRDEEEDEDREDYLRNPYMKNSPY